MACCVVPAIFTVCAPVPSSSYTAVYKQGVTIGDCQTYQPKEWFSVIPSFKLFGSSFYLVMLLTPESPFLTCGTTLLRSLKLWSTVQRSRLSHGVLFFLLWSGYWAWRYVKIPLFWRLLQTSGFSQAGHADYALWKLRKWQASAKIQPCCGLFILKATLKAKKSRSIMGIFKTAIKKWTTISLLANML